MIRQEPFSHAGIFDDDDRKRIAAGQDVYLTIMTFGHPLHPVMLEVRTADEMVSGVEECGQDDNWADTLENIEQRA